ncbi:MAG: hypothetical protein M1831_007468 [Alyxoria varia]|nr:MAG: hypothetical protein M1831_007468 [Alyxoria varia]
MQQLQDAQKIENYPFLTLSEFREACGSFAIETESSLKGYGKGGRRGNSQEQVTGVEVVDDDTNECFGGESQRYLKLWKQFEPNSVADDECPPTGERSRETNQVEGLEDGDDEETEAVEEDDEEALPRAQAPELAQNIVQVEYNVVLSATYRVPVLYFFLEDEPTKKHKDRSLEPVYRHVIPSSWKPQVEGVGVMGAVSYDCHPVTSKLAFFVHPCNTAEAMREIGKSLEVTLKNYLRVWVGLVGGCVGLHVPGSAVGLTRQRG